MIANDNLFNKVTAVYEQRRTNAANKSYELNRALNNNKTFAQNRQKLSDIIFAIQKAEYTNDLSNIQALYKERDLLKQQRQDFLKKAGLTEQDLQPNYNCKICEDTGYLDGGGLCSCFYKTLSDVIDEQLGTEKRELPSYDHFKTTTQEEKLLKTTLQKYCESFPSEKTRNLIFLGATGTGKTFSAGCIANRLMQKNANVIFLSAVKLNDVFLKYHTSSERDKSVIFQLLTNCDLLVIDDLGTEPVLKNVTVEYLTSFISERIVLKRPYIITTNLDLNAIQQRYTERFLSRISESVTAKINFSGEDKRRK